MRAPTSRHSWGPLGTGWKAEDRTTKNAKNRAPEKYFSITRARTGQRAPIYCAIHNIQSPRAKCADNPHIYTQKQRKKYQKKKAGKKSRTKSILIAPMCYALRHNGDVHFWATFGIAGEIKMKTRQKTVYSNYSASNDDHQLIKRLVYPEKSRMRGGKKTVHALAEKRGK